MPYSLRKTPHGYGVYNKIKKIWKSYNTTKTKATAQMRLLYMIEGRKKM